MVGFLSLLVPWYLSHSLSIHNIKYNYFLRPWPVKLPIDWKLQDRPRTKPASMSQSFVASWHNLFLRVDMQGHNGITSWLPVSHQLIVQTHFFMFWSHPTLKPLEKRILKLSFWDGGCSKTFKHAFNHWKPGGDPILTRPRTSSPRTTLLTPNGNTFLKIW